MTQLEALPTLTAEQKAKMAKQLAEDHDQEMIERYIRVRDARKAREQERRVRLWRKRKAWDLAVVSGVVFLGLMHSYEGWSTWVVVLAGFALVLLRYDFLHFSKDRDGSTL